VVVVGIGNSAADIASELSWHAAEVTLSTRRSAHIIPRYLFGRPADTFTNPTVSRLPIGVQRAAYKVLLRIARGRQSKYGLPAPDHELLEAHPTLSQDLLQLVRSGDIVVKPNIDRLDGRTVWFEDGSSVETDAIIYATGYRVDFPFIPMEVLVAKDNVLPLYRKVVHPDLDGLYFVGLIQPVGAIMPLAEQQAEWVSRLIEGAPLPTAHEMARSIDEDQQELEARYVPSKRHTLQVDYFPYKQLMMAEVAMADEALAEGDASRAAEEVGG
jgi:cation diffusion facilitator CzcD-associated flavoprotein CzcO